MKRIILRDKNGEGLREGDRVIIRSTDYYVKHEKFEEIKGKLMYDKAFMAHAVRGDNDKRYLLMDILVVSDLKEDGELWHREIEKE